MRNLTIAKSGLDKKWKKRDLYMWFNTLNDTEPKFTPSRRAAATLSRIRQQGGNCLRCSRIRTLDLGRMRNLREELKLRSKESSGKEYGMTVCIRLEQLGPIWIDIFMMMDSPEQIYYAPVYAETHQLIRSSKIGEFHLPIASKK